MGLRIIDLDIDESLSANTRVEEVGFVLQPAIETELIYFTSQEFEDTISDYPQYITDNALRAKKWVEQNGYGSCMTPVGKARLNQLANREPISVLTIKRMKAYADRHKKDLEASKSFDDGCGYLAWYSWGLDETGRVEKWLESFLERQEEMAVVGERGGIKESKKAPKSDTPNRNPKGEGTAKGDASSSRGAEVSARVEETLKEKADDFNERYKDKLGYGVDVGMLKSVYQRGVGAYNVSHSPEVKSAEQWAMARVNAFLYLVKEGRPENKKYDGDNDLLPTKHPKKQSKEEMEYEPSLPPYVDYATGDTKNDMLIEPILFVKRKPYERRDEYIGRCTAYLIKNEGKPKDQAYAICISEADSFAKGDKVSFDWDETLSTARGFEIAMGEKNNESTLYIISARQDMTGEMLRKAVELEIPQSRIFTLGSNKAKIEKIRELDIDRHYDNNQDVIDELDSVGVQFNCGCMDEFIEMSTINEKYNLVGFIDGEPLFSTPVEAENYGKEKHSCNGHHVHYDDEGNEVYMACEVHPTEEDEYSFGVQDYSEEEIETAKMLKFLAETDRQQFEAVIGAMRGATETEIKRRKHKNVTTYFRYDRVLAGSPDREFCTSIEGRYFRRLEIDLLKDINRDFGHQKQPYSKWLYKGGPNCVHAWRKFLVQEDNVVDDGFVEGKPGTPPKSMENNGYYSPETKRKSEQAYIISQQNMSKQTFKSDNDKRMLYSPLMLPNVLIPRMENNQKYYVRFTPQTIEKIQRKFMIEQRLRSNNYEHSEQKFNDVVMVESWIISGDSDKAYELGFTKENAPIGSWMAGYKVLDTPEGDTIWNDYIKSGKVKGLSVEGEFLLKFSKQDFNRYDLAFEKIVEILKQVE